MSSHAKHLQPIACTSELVASVAQLALANASAFELTGADLAEAVAFEFEQLLYQALGVPMGAPTETGYFLLPTAGGVGAKP